MKRFTLSLAIVAMVAGTMTLETYAGGRGHSNGRSGFSRSSSSRSNFSSRSRGNFQSRNNGMRSRTSTMKAPQNFNHRVTNTRMNQNSFSKMQHKGSSLQPRTSMKQVHSQFNNKKPGNTFTRPTRKPFTGNNTMKPKPFPKPLDPGIGNGKPGNGGITRPGKNPFTGIGSTKPKPRPFPKPLDPGIGNGKPGNGGITPPKPGMGAPKPRPRPRPPGAP